MKLAYLFSLFLFIKGVRAESQNQRLSKLLNESHYDYTVPPGFENGTLTNVSVYIRFYNIHSVNEETMDFSTEMFVQLKWNDPRLRHKFWSFPTSTLKLFLVPEFINKVWRPNVYFSNEKTAKIHDVPQRNEVMYILDDGEIIYNMRVSMKHGCFMKLMLYPFDRQTCTVALMSYSYDSDIIQLTWDELGVEQPETEFLHFDLKTVNLRKDVLYTKVGNFSRLSLDIVLDRRPNHYILILYIPSLFIIILSWISFWIDPQIVHGRLSIGSVCVLTMVSNHAGIQARVPSASYMKAVDVWMIGCEFFVFMAVMEFACVYYLFVYPATKNQKEKPPNLNYGSCKSTQTNHNKKGKMETSFDETNSLIKSVRIDQSNSQKVCENSEGERQTDKLNQVDKCSRWMFPLLFFCLIIVYASFYIKMGYNQE